MRSVSFVHLLLLVAGSAGSAFSPIVACNRTNSAPTAARVSRTVAEAAASARDVTLPRSSGANAPPEPSISLVVSRADVRLDGDPYRVAEVPADSASGFSDDDKRNGRSDLWVTPIEHALRGERERSGALPQASVASERAPSLVVIADEHASYRILREIIFTAAQAGMGSVHVAARAADDGRVVALRIVTPSHALEAPSVRLGVDGIAVRFGDVALGAGCDEDRDGLAVARAPDGDYDWAALDTCLRKLRATSPALADQAVALLEAEDAIELAVVVRAMDTLRMTFADGVALVAPSVGAERREDGGAK